MTPAITLENCDVLITAEEAFCAFEEAVLNANDSLVAGFRLFDLATTLRSNAACETGETWFDLLAHKLKQGLAITLTLTDFDPVVRPDMHACTWRTMRAVERLRDHAPDPDLLTVTASMHGARIGWLSAAGLWVKSRGLLAKEARRYNDLEPDARQRFEQERPGVVARLRFDADGRTRAPLWPPARLVPATHHQKLAVIDARLVYIGGLDLNDRRYDTKAHDQDSEQTWHDVQVMIRDTGLAAAALTHLGEFSPVTAGQTTAEPTSKPFLRTLSAPRQSPVAALSPKRVSREIRQAHLDHIATAQDLIYLETQFLRDRDITTALCGAAARARELGLVVILPAAPEDVAFGNARSSDARYGEYLQAKCLSRLRHAFGSRLFTGAPVQPRHRPSDDRSTLSDAPLLYVHAKVSVFDDAVAIVSSANLNGRSLNWDTEAGVELTDSDLVRHLKTRCMAHWLPDEHLTPYLGGSATVTAWRSHAQSNANDPPEKRRSFIVPYKVSPARRFGRNLPGVPKEMV